MGILQPPFVLPGQSGVIGATKYMVTTDSLATITAAGYLNNIDLAVYPIAASDVISCLYSYNLQTNSGTFAIFTVSLSNGVVSLIEWSNPGNVLLPVVSGDFAVFNGTSGQIKDSGLLPSSTSSQLYVATTPGSLTSGQIAKFNDANGTLANSGILASNVMVLNAANALTGAGSISLVKGTGTEAANAVTVNNNAGVITTSSLTTAGGSSYAITWTNSFISASSVILLTLMGGTNTTENITLKATAGSGTSTLTIYNNTAATALNGTIIIGFAVF
jgi:hypothetical protein